MVRPRVEAQVGRKLRERVRERARRVRAGVDAAPGRRVAERDPREGVRRLDPRVAGAVEPRVGRRRDGVAAEVVLRR
jgi:hypothetical protein